MGQAAPPLARGVRTVPRYGWRGGWPGRCSMAGPLARPRRLSGWRVARLKSDGDQVADLFQIAPQLAQAELITKHRKCIALHIILHECGGKEGFPRYWVKAFMHHRVNP